MKYLVLIWISLFSVMTNAATPALIDSANEGGKGGAGIVTNGIPMTFYSAGLYVEPHSEELDLTSLKYLISFTQWMPFLGTATKAKLLNAILQSPQHQYLVVQESQFTETTKARVIAEFERVTHVPIDELKLYALTDTNSRKTFLFPRFFQLGMKDQAAILFHEAYWLINPNTTYSTVVDAEMAFEAVLDQPKNQARILELMKYVSTTSDLLFYAVDSDLRTGVLRKFLDRKNRFTYDELFGQDYLLCTERGGGVSCNPYLNVQLAALTVQYPQSLFLRLLISYMPKEPTDGPGIFYWGTYDGYKCGLSGIYTTPIGEYTFRSEGNESCRVKFTTALSPTAIPFTYLPAECDKTYLSECGSGWIQKGLALEMNGE